MLVSLSLRVNFELLISSITTMVIKQYYYYNCLSFLILLLSKDVGIVRGEQCKADGTPNDNGPYFPYNLGDNTKLSPTIVPPGVESSKTCCGHFLDHTSASLIPDQGGMRINNYTLGAEGRSYCIVGEHINGTALSITPPLQGFGPLIEHFFDIGSFIHPERPSKMNRYVKYKDPIFGKRDSTCQNSKGEATCDDTRFRPPYFTEQKDASCLNPYIVDVKEITAHDIRLQNYLRIRVYAANINQHQPVSPGSCATGKMRWLMLEVRDALGLVVGHFTDEVPCPQKDEAPNGPNSIPGKIIYGTWDNIMPCMFAPRRSVSVRNKLYNIVNIQQLLHLNPV
jgi:hypothetical protein